MTRSRPLLWGGAVVGLLGGVAGLSYRYEPILEKRALQWAKQKAIQYYVSHVAPSLPFQIENFEINTSWAELKKGKVSRLQATLTHPLGRIHVESPIEISELRKPSPQYLFQLRPTLLLEGASCDPLPLQVQIVAPQSLQKVDTIQIAASLPHWKCAALHLATEHVALQAELRGKSLNSKLSAQSVEWSPKATQVVHASHTQWTASSAIDSNEIKTSLQIDQAEILWNENYGELNLKPFPLNATLRLNSKRNTIQSAHLHFPLLDLQWNPQQLQWKSFPILANELSNTLIQNLGKGTGWFGNANALKDYEFKSGTLQTEGTWNLKAGHQALPSALSALETMSTQTEIRDLTFQAKKTAFHFRGGHLFAQSVGTDLKLETSVENFHFFQFSGKLSPWKLVAHEGKFESPLPLPLKIEGLRLQVGNVSGSYDLEHNHYQVKTSVELEETPLYAFLAPLCYDAARIPPAQLRASFPSIQIQNEHIHIQGEAEASLWGGKIQFQGLSAQHLDTDIPELNFTTDFSGIDLLPLGNWMNFGEMKGTLQGYAHQVKLQKWLPTHFDFRIDALPHRNWIEFSPESMKNLIGLFAGEAVDQIPGFANDPFFGWVSGRLGGFDLKYAGLSLFADRGTILIETHDPPEIYRILKKHFIFWGRRFKMPLSASTYPVAMDQMGLTRVALVMADQIKALAEKKKAEKNEVHETESRFLSPQHCSTPLSTSSR